MAQYPVADIVGNLARGYSLGAGIQRDQEEAADRAAARVTASQDRAYALTRRDRQSVLDMRDDAAYQRGVDTQLPVEKVRAVNEAQADDAVEGLSFNRSQRQRTLQTQPTVAEVVADRDLDRTGKKLGLERDRVGIEAARTTMKNAADDRSRQQARDDALGQLAALDHPAVQAATKDPAFQKDVLDLYGAIHKGENVTAGMSRFLPVVQRVFGDKVKSNVGQKLDGTNDVIVDNQIANVHEAPGDPDSVIMELNVTAKRPDGSTYKISAPLTNDRSSAPSATIKKFSKAELGDGLDHLAGAVMDAHDGFNIDEAQGHLEQEFLKNGGKLSELPRYQRALGDNGAITRDLDSLAAKYTGGDKAKAIAMYKDLKQAATKTSDPQEMRLKVVQSITQAGQIRDPAKIREAADGMMQWIASGSAPANVGTQAPAAAPAAAAAPAYAEGQTASNPKTGERVIYKGGQWVPAK